MRLAKQYSYSWSFRFLRDLVAVDNWKDMLQSITEIDQNIKDDLEFLGGHALKTIDDKLENLQTQMVTSLDLITEARNEAKVLIRHLLPFFHSCPIYPSILKELSLHTCSLFKGIQAIAIT